MKTFLLGFISRSIGGLIFSKLTYRKLDQSGNFNEIDSFPLFSNTITNQEALWRLLWRCCDFRNVETSFDFIKLEEMFKEWCDNLIRNFTNNFGKLKNDFLPASNARTSNIFIVIGSIKTVLRPSDRLNAKHYSETYGNQASF